MNLTINFGTTPLLHHNRERLKDATILPVSSPTEGLNLFQTVKVALRTALRTSNKVVRSGEDVAFGGVFRCNAGLKQEFGNKKVFSTPLTEHRIVGVAVGATAEGMRPAVEIQFADYVLPAFDQVVNEAAKFRYREGTTGENVGGLVICKACEGVGHGPR